MVPIPTRSLFRSRWSALAWAAAVCLAAVEVAGGHSKTAANVDAADAPDNAVAQASALLADE